MLVMLVKNIVSLITAVSTLKRCWPMEVSTIKYWLHHFVRWFRNGEACVNWGLAYEQYSNNSE